jgi:hypothetical protein
MNTATGINVTSSLLERRKVSMQARTAWVNLLRSSTSLSDTMTRILVIVLIPKAEHLSVGLLDTIPGEGVSAQVLLLPTQCQISMLMLMEEEWMSKMK